MAGPAGEACNKCYFWVAFGGGEEEDGELYEVGSCHRIPPTIPGAEGDRDPSVYAWMGANSKSSYWCGEFKPKPSPSTP